MTRVAIVVPNLHKLMFDTQGFGGAEVEAYNLAQGLNDDPRFEVIAMVIANPAELVQKYKNIKLISTRPYNPRMWSGNIVKNILGAIVTIWRVDADVYINFPASIETILVSFVSWLRRRRFIYRVVHDWETNYTDLSNNIFRDQSWPNRLLPKFFVLALKRAKYVTVSKNGQKQQLIKNYQIPANKIAVVNNLVATKLVKGIHPKEFILWVGRIHPMKRPEIFLALARNFPNEKFVMVAPLNEGFENLYREIIKEVKNIPNIEFIPGVPNNGIWEYYQKAKFLVLTSEAEGQSNVLMEAWLSGLPVISLSFDPDGVIISQGLGFVCADNYEKLVAATRTLLHDDQERHQMAQKVLEFSNDHYDIKKSIDVYKQLILKS